MNRYIHRTDVPSTSSVSIDGSVVEFSPATQEAWAGFPVNATFLEVSFLYEYFPRYFRPVVSREDVCICIYIHVYTYDRMVINLGSIFLVEIS